MDKTASSIDELLFVYGTLRDPEMQRAVTGRGQEGIAATLEGYACRSVKIEREEYPIAVPSLNSSIDGVLLSVAAAELTLYDEYETIAYERIRVSLKCGTDAWCYVKRNDR
jgi:gamma-glutamylcyclotransferase (GGCT)/AIG2-like uncharacterized protein YtfP